MKNSKLSKNDKIDSIFAYGGCLIIVAGFIPLFFEMCGVFSNSYEFRKNNLIKTNIIKTNIKKTEKTNDALYL